MDKKRILIAIGFFLLCIGLGYLIYRFFFAGAPSPETLPPGTTTTSTTGVFPTAGQGGAKTPGGDQTTDLPTSITKPGSQADDQQKGAVTQVISDAISGVKANKDGMRYYNTEDGKFYRLGPDGKPVPLDDKVFFNVDKVTWAPQKNESILEYPDGSNIYYNFETKKQVTLPKHWQEFSFAPTSDKIAAKSIGLSSEANWLISASPDGQNVRLVESMGENADRVNVDWSPNQQIIATSRTGEAMGEDQQQVLMIGQNHENFKGITVEGRGLKSSWSPTGGKLLYSVHSARSDFKPELWVVNSQVGTLGSERKLLNINTWADKCTFSDDRYVYCGVPTDLQRGAGFVPKNADQIPDNIYKIDTQTGVKTQLPIREDHVIQSMFLGEDGKTLYFTDKNQAGLFTVLQ